MAGVLFDLDLTLINSSSAEALRKARQWPQVYGLIPAFVVYDGITDLLSMLIERDVPIGIVTSSPGSYCTRVIEHHNLRIAKRVCYHDTTRRKPHPDPMLKGIELLGIPAEQVWAVGDDPKDMQSAKAAAARAVGVTWGAADQAALRAAGADMVFDSVAELHSFFDELTRTA